MLPFQIPGTVHGHWLRRVGVKLVSAPSLTLQFLEARGFGGVAAGTSSMLLAAWLSLHVSQNRMRDASLSYSLALREERIHVNPKSGNSKRAGIPARTARLHKSADSKAYMPFVQPCRSPYLHFEDRPQFL